MKAIIVHSFGGPEVLQYGDAPRPVLQPDDVLIKVYATGVNPVDWKVRKGIYQKRLLPFIPGWDVSGVIEETGANVTGFSKGDEVYARPDISRDGTYAEYVAVRASETGFKPASVDHTTAAAVPLAGQTAWEGLFEKGQLKAGEKILIHGAAGGVGSYAVQFARWKGAYVIGTASAGNKQFVTELGADEAIDYKSTPFERKLKDLDMVFDTIGGDVQLRSALVLRKGGVLVSTVGIQHQKTFDAKGIRSAGYMAKSKPENLAAIAKLIDAGTVKPVITKILPLQEAGEAHRLSEEGHVRGKIVLQVAATDKLKVKREAREQVESEEL